MKFSNICMQKHKFDNKKSKCRYVFNILLLIIFAIFLLRVVGLDRDLPNFGLTFYQAKDEGTYSTMSILYYHYESLTAADNMEIVIAPTFRANIIGNLLQFFTMKLLGDNYYGFRMPYVLIAFGITLLIYLTFNKIIELYKLPTASKWMTLPIILYIVFDFSFLMSSRCVENSSVRALVTILCIYLWIKYSYDLRKRYFWLGFLSIISIFFVYYSNVHLLVVSCIIGGIKVIQLILKKENDCIKYLKYWGVGFGIGHLIVEIYYLAVWKSGCWTNLLSSVNSFSDRVVTASQSSEAKLLTYLKGFLTFWSSNMFFFNFLVVVLTIIAICTNILAFIKVKDENILLILGILFAMIIQATFTNDWMERKTISIYPVVYINIFLAITMLKWGEYQIRKKLINGICALSILLIIPLLYSMIRFRISRNYFIDFEQIDISIWAILTLIQVLFICIFLIAAIFAKKRIYTGALLISFCFALSINAYFSIKYVYTYRKYSEKEAMQGIGELVGDEYVAGPYTYAYTLYNDIKPVWNADNYCIDYIKDGKIKYFCDYSMGPYYVNLMNPDRDYFLVQSFDRELIAQGVAFPIGLFEKN
ncbi:hypothetical protein [Luxibacter massiliensis]|uniref:hypothetical protein n=1 Tax=Luxibacter massiliensis TaxID=2219695 RepID=UPI000F06B306|nr:hypothetical protein [Luxibacter massiliensis]